MTKTLTGRASGVLLSAALLSGCGSDGGAANTGGGQQGAPQLDFSAFDAAVDQFVAESELAGASAVVVHKDWGLVHSSGYGDYDADRLYLVASASKVLSVGILMRLVDQGKLDLDAPIGDVLGDWAGNKPELTVAQLVSNSSGLVGLLDNPGYVPYLCQYTDAGSLDACAKAIYSADDAKDRKTPDTEFHYGGGQWQLAGGIAEHVAGKPWKELIQEAYVDGCGATTLGYTNQFLKAAASGGLAAALSYPVFFDGDPSTLPVTENPSIEGGAYITAQDYAKLLLMHLNGGLCGDERILSAESVKRMQQDRIGEKYGGNAPDASYQGYGLGWWVNREEPGSVSDVGAYGAIPWIDNSRGYAAFVVMQADSVKGLQARDKLRPVLAELFDAAEQAK